MKLIRMSTIYLLGFLFLTGINPVPPGYNPNLTIEEHRRQEEFLRKQREKQMKDAAQQYFDEDAIVDVTAHIYDAKSGSPIEGKISYLIMKSGKTYTFSKKKKENYQAKIRKISDIQLLFQSSQYYSINELISIDQLKPLEKLDITAKLLKKAELDGAATVDILFDSDSSVLKPIYNEILLVFVKTLKSNPTLSLIIKGYTGRDAPSQKVAYELSLARANSIRDFLAKEGIAMQRLQAIPMGIGENQKDPTREYRAELFLIDLTE